MFQLCIICNDSDIDIIPLCSHTIEILSRSVALDGHENKSDHCCYFVSNKNRSVLHGRCYMYIVPRQYYLQNFTSSVSWVDLDLIYAKIKFGYIGFCIGKSENSRFFRKYSSL